MFYIKISHCRLHSKRCCLTLEAPAVTNTIYIHLQWIKELSLAHCTSSNTSELHSHNNVVWIGGTKCSWLLNQCVFSAAFVSWPNAVWNQLIAVGCWWRPDNFVTVCQELQCFRSQFLFQLLPKVSFLSFKQKKVIEMWVRFSCRPFSFGIDRPSAPYLFFRRTLVSALLVADSTKVGEKISLLNPTMPMFGQWYGNEVYKNWAKMMHLISKALYIHLVVCHFFTTVFCSM